jgi:hypothetical protein
MNRRSLGALALVIILLMVIVATAGLDNLPRDLRKSIDAAAASFQTDRSQFAQDRDFVNRAVSDEPALFRTKAAGYRDRLQRDDSCFVSAATELAALQQLHKANRRTDTDKARAELAKFDSIRKGCTADSTDLRAEASRWIGYKQQLPKRLAEMKAGYDALHAFDVDAAAAPAENAMTDWPAKRADLEARVNRLKQVKEQGEQAWDASAPLRAAAEAKKFDNFDYASLFQDADRIDSANRELKESSESLNQLSAQLYTSWDKLVTDVEDNHGVREKVRIVRTKYKDATLANGEVTSEERWEDATQSAKDLERQEGMVVARKAAGKYDSEAERVVQPPAIAYVAPPGQSNSYGGWHNGVWEWLPQYLILSHLLNASRGPISSGDFNAYEQARRRGEVYYGRSDGFRWWHAPRTTIPSGGGGGITGRARDWANSRSSGTSSGGGGFYTERPKGYSGSVYQNRGSYSGSQYQSRGGSYGSFGSRSYSRGYSGGARSFGRGGRR